MPKAILESVNWNFTKETTKAGLTYIKAYKTRWFPELKTSKRVMRRHVGRLLDDDQIVISEKFIADHPEYANGPWYWGIDKRPVSYDEYRRQFPEKPGVPPVDEDDTEPQPTLSIGLTWAAVEFARNHGILTHLQEVFGKQLGEELLYLAIFKLAGGTSMMTYDVWRQLNWMPNHLRMSSQKISEILAAVSRQNVTDYFALRHKRQGEVWERIFAKRPELKDKPIAYALDNTSISTYSSTIAEAQYGHAKRDEHLKQVNYTVVCDQCSGDIVFTYLYDGAINDVTALKDILAEMSAAQFDLSKNVLVTDRGYSSISNVQKLINLDLAYVQGVRLCEDSIKRQFEKHEAALNSVGFYDGDLQVSAYTYKEPWQQTTDAGRLKLNTYVHLYRLDGKQEAQRLLIWKNTKEILDLMAKNLRVPSELWDEYRHFLIETTDEHGKTRLVQNVSKIDRLSKQAAYFVLRSNCIADPFEALRIYRRRGVVEQDFNQLKNWVDGDRLHVGANSLHGKVLVNTLATALRMMILVTAKRQADRRPQLKIPGNSIDFLLKELELIRAQKRKNANAWVRGSISATRRRYLELLELPEPPRLLYIGIR